MHKGHTMDSKSAGGSPLYLLERADVGLVQLDRDLRVGLVVSNDEFDRAPRNAALPIDDRLDLG